MLRKQRIHEPKRGRQLEHSGEFELDLLTQGTATVAAPSEPARTPIAAITVVASLAEMRAAVNRVATSAQRLMSIYTPNLEPELYDQTEFLDIMKRFVLARNFAKARVLLGEAGRAIRDNNRFIAMGRRLQSYIDIRVVQHRIPQQAAAYIIADDRAIALRPRDDRWDGIADFNNPAIARAHLAEFDAIWLANAPLPAIRVAQR